MANLVEEPKPDLEQLLSVLIVQNQRIYDVLLVLLGLSNEERFEQVVSLHERLENVGPVPFQVNDD